jgi:hypothetical protein
MRTKFCLRRLKGRDHSEDPSVVTRVILKHKFGSRVGVWSGFIWLRIGAGGGLL